MASSRYINTNFWRDNYIMELDPSEKLLFMYFLTNPNTTIAGVYEINLRQVAFDTGFDLDMVKKILARFCRDGKMYYQEGWLILRNFIKHQRMNPSIKQGIERVLESVPPTIRPRLREEYIDGQTSLFIEAVDSLGTVWGETDTLKPNLNSNLNLTLTKPKPHAAETAGQDDNDFGKKATTKEIDGMFGYWQSEVGYAVTSKVRQNREYCGRLLKEYSKPEIALMIKAAALASEDQYSPGVSNFIDLYRKWDALKLWGKKKGMKQRATAQF